MAEIQVRQLVIGDAGAFSALRREALAAEPLAFSSSPEDDRVLDPAFLRARLSEPGENVIFGACARELAGAVGVYRDPGRKARHKAHVWGLYVRPGHRSRGVGSQLLSAAVAFARSLPEVRQVHLAVSEIAQPALRLYQRHGFTVWGTEPAALLHEGRMVSELHMVLALG